VTDIKDKISTRQAMLLFLTIVYSPTVRFMGGFTADRAKQAGWLAPIFSLIPLLILIMILQSIYIKYKDVSLMDAIYDILGKPIGKCIILVYIIWIGILNSLYVRYYAERLTISTYENTDYKVFIITMLILVLLILPHGIKVLARMNEIIFPILLIVFIIFMVLLIPNIDLAKLTPISYTDIIPMFNASIGINGLWGYVLFVFFIGDKIKDKENIQNAGIKASMFLVVATILIIIASIGTLGHTIIKRTSLSFLAAVKEISYFGVIDRLESIQVVTWVLSDFMIIAVFTYIILDLIKSFLNLKKTSYLINISLVLLYVFSVYLGRNIFELQTFSGDFAIYFNSILAFGVPVIVWGVGKVRGKV